MIKKGKQNPCKTPWPTKKAMEQIYQKHLWGGKEHIFYSGDGSHAPEIIDPYIYCMVSFFSAFEPLLRVCDLGCGDFNIGQALVPYTATYTAVDIVPSLIAYNTEKFKDDKVSFRCADIATDPLPSADCALLRQVLQHLSNAEVAQVVAKLVRYKHVILTEHIPEGTFMPNTDIISGQGTRLKKNSGLVLTSEPFRLRPKKEKRLLSLVPEKYGGSIVTTYYQMF